MAAALSFSAPAQVAGTVALLWRGVTFYFDLLAGWLLFTRYLARARTKTGGPGEGPPVG